MTDSLTGDTPISLLETAEDLGVQRATGAKENAAGEGSVQYMKIGDSTTESIKGQIQANEDMLNGMKPVAIIQISDMPKGIQKQRQWAINRLKNTGYAVQNMEHGTIEFTPRQINTGLNYLDEPGEIAAFAALPSVLKRGKTIDQHDRHKGRARGSITIAAPVVINGVRGNMAVALTQTSKTHYHTHRIVMPDGSTFVFENKNAKAKPAEDQPGKANVSRPSLRRSNDIVTDAPAKSKSENEQKQTWDNTVDTGGNAIEVDAEDGTANVQFSRWTWEQSDYVTEREEAATTIAEKLGISKKKALDYIDSVNSVAKMIADSKGRLDYDDTGRSPFVSNAEYGGSFDFTTLCRKRRLLTGF